MKRKTFDSYTYGEAKTAGEQHVVFTCQIGDQPKIIAFLQENVRTIEPKVVTHPTNLSHGAYGKYSRYQIIQHKYAGRGSRRRWRIYRGDRGEKSSERQASYYPA